MKRFFPRVAVWTGLLVWLALAYLLFTGILNGRSWDGWEIAYLLPGWVGLFLPFAAFAGGVAAYSITSPPALVCRALLLVLISYGLLAYLSPLADHRARASEGADLVAEFPLGPLTPSTLVQVRDLSEADPPDRYSFRVGQPFERPPNWLTYLLHGPVVVALFALLAALLGQRAGFLTSGLSPPTRWNARWALGLATGIAFFLAGAAGGGWVRANPSRSGVLGAWLPLLLPLGELALLISLTRLRGIDCSIRQSQASDV
ncbi:MAG: hypothetical protein KJN92_07280 [Gemmatimonadetes bacterium]|nr:hypothetical protein [Gemmatimonadota bacterium]